MRAYVGITDYEWATFLSRRPDIDEVNFWKPGGAQGFAALQPGAPFLFKLHAPRNVIVGGGFFVHFTRLPTSIAWEAFGEKNGTSSLHDMRARIEKYRKSPPTRDDYSIGCIILGEPFFFAERDWIPVPPDWHLSIQQGKTYELTHSPGRELWDGVQARLLSAGTREVAARVMEPEPPRYGDPTVVFPRLGQGTFRAMVTDAYDRRCAITGEKTLPVLDAAHIKPYASHGLHRVQNGLLLRKDLHRLFDLGYVTVNPDNRVGVSRCIREEFSNGRDYYALDGRTIRLPEESAWRPDRQFLEWHAETIFRR